jgi:putative membrane protein
MTFVDPLAVMLIGLAMGTLLGAFYFFFSARGDKEQIKSLTIPAIGVGLFEILSGGYMSFSWVMNTTHVYAYNMEFGDPLLLFGIVLVITAIMVYRDMHIGLMPLLIMLVGIYVLVGAYNIVTDNMESGGNLIAAMGLYIFDGVGAVLTPVLYIKPTTSTGKTLYYVEWIILGIGTIFALILGYGAFNSHVGNPP